METPVNLFENSIWHDTHDYPEGTKVRYLRDEQGAKTVLLKYPKGFYMAPHSHITAEQHVIMEGEYTIEGKVYHAGTYQKFKAHENHGPFKSKHGALVLVMWDPYQPDK